MAYEALPDGLEANILVVCDSLLELGKDGSTKIEQ